MTERGAREHLDVFVPEPKLCTDNGAMIALAGAGAYAVRGGDSWTLNADAAWRI
jgi:tRNA A37 threonylcarbamoyltransferase TsaD